MLHYADRMAHPLNRGQRRQTPDANERERYRDPDRDRELLDELDGYEQQREGRTS